MEKTPLFSQKQVGPLLLWVLSLVFYGNVFWAIASSELPSIGRAAFLMEKQFWAGREDFFRFQDPGLSFSLFGAYLPKKGSVSFLTDVPFRPQDKNIEYLQAAQGKLAPLLLNPKPEEAIAIIFCSKDAVAKERMQSAGYRPAKVLGDGKIIAEKTL